MIGRSECSIWPEYQADWRVENEKEICSTDYDRDSCMDCA